MTTMFMILFAGKWTQTLHPFFNIGQLLKAKLLIQAMRVVGGEQPAADMFQVGMFEHALHQPFAQSMSAKIFVDEDIAEIGNDGKISDDPRHANLTAAFVHAKDKRVGKCLLRAFARTCLCPVGAGKKIIHGVHIQAGWVRADGELIAMGFEYLRHAASLSQHGIIHLIST